MTHLPSFDDVTAAAERIDAHVHRTPVMTSSSVDALIGRRVHFKCEHLQKAGAFKARGATNAVLCLDDAAAVRGVAAHSSGNHAAALALAARTRGIPCHVVMPSTVPAAKREAASRYGAAVVLCEPTLDARASALSAVVESTGATEVHPYDDPLVIAGQGTAALELLEQVPGIGAIVAPVSGGGLLSGTAIAAHGIDPGVAIFGAEPIGADDAHRSLSSDTLVGNDAAASVADGLLAALSPRTFAILRTHHVEVVTVTDEAMLEATTLLFTRLKQVVEPSAASALAALAALAARGSPLPEDIGVILSGGNVDLHDPPIRLARQG